MSSKFLMTQREIAEASGYSQQFISKIINGDSRPHPDTAEELEKATGICREAWLWPDDRHWNPYIPFSDAKPCLTCRFRFSRIKRWRDIGVEHLKANPTREGLKELLEGIAMFNNFNVENMLLGYCAVRDDHIEILARIGRRVVKTDNVDWEYAENRFPWFWTQVVKEQSDMYFPHLHRDIPTEAQTDLNWVLKHGHRSVYVAMADRFYFQITAFAPEDFFLIDPNSFEQIKENTATLRPFIEHLL